MKKFFGRAKRAWVGYWGKTYWEAARLVNTDHDTRFEGVYLEEKGKMVGPFTMRFSEPFVTVLEEE